MKLLLETINLRINLIQGPHHRIHRTSLKELCLSCHRFCDPSILYPTGAEKSPTDDQLTGELN